MNNKFIKTLSCLLVILAVTAATVFLFGGKKKYVEVDGIIKAVEYNLIEVIDAQSNKENINNELNLCLDYFKNNKVNTVILPLNEENNSIIETDEFNYIYKSNKLFNKATVVDRLRDVLVKENIQMYLQVDCAQLSQSQITNIVTKALKDTKAEGILLINYQDSNEFLVSLKNIIGKLSGNCGLYLQSHTTEDIKLVNSLNVVDGFMLEGGTQEQYTYLKNNVLSDKKLIMHYSATNFAGDIFVLNNFETFDGCVIAAFTDDNIDLTLPLLSLEKKEGIPLFGFDIETQFKVSYPEKDISVYYSGIYATGTGEPGGVVSLNGVDYQAASDGTFGIYIKLSVGENVLNFSQNGITHKITVTRKKYTSTGTTSKQDSTKKASKGQKIQTANALTSIISDMSNDSSIIAGVPAGTVLTVESSHLTTRGSTKTYAYKLSNGGYVLAKNVIWLSSSEQQAVLNGSISAQSNGDEIISVETTGMPAVISKWEDDILTFTFLDTKLENLPTLSGGMFSNFSVKYENGSTVLSIQENASNPLWGFDVNTTNDYTAIYLKKSPSISSTNLPLTNVTILLDPGHGLQDSGALGVTGLGGPNEKHLNLAVGLATKNLLEDLGAKVILTREDDSFLTLEERRSLVREKKPDLFISIHHNSMDYSYDSTNTSGAECYYFSPQSKAFAQAMALNISENTQRKNRGEKYGYFYVTRTDIAPSVLMEYSFVNNPFEYSKTYSDKDIYAAAYGTVQAILNVIP